MDWDTRKQLELLRKRITRVEGEIHTCHEDIRTCKIAIHHLNKELKTLAEAVNTNTEILDVIANTLPTITDTQKKIIKITKKHQTAINNIAKITGVDDAIKEEKKKDYIS